MNSTSHGDNFHSKGVRKVDSSPFLMVSDYQKVFNQVKDENPNNAVGALRQTTIRRLSLMHMEKEKEESQSRRKIEGEQRRSFELVDLKLGQVVSAFVEKIRKAHSAGNESNTSQSIDNCSTHNSVWDVIEKSPHHRILVEDHRIGYDHTNNGLRRQSSSCTFNRRRSQASLSNSSSAEHLFGLGASLNLPQIIGNVFQASPTDEQEINLAPRKSVDDFSTAVQSCCDVIKVDEMSVHSMMSNRSELHVENVASSAIEDIAQEDLHLITNSSDFLTKCQCENNDSINIPAYVKYNRFGNYFNSGNSKISETVSSEPSYSSETNYGFDTSDLIVGFPDRYSGSIEVCENECDDSIFTDGFAFDFSAWEKDRPTMT